MLKTYISAGIGQKWKMTKGKEQFHHLRRSIHYAFIIFFREHGIKYDLVIYDETPPTCLPTTSTSIGPSSFVVRRRFGGFISSAGKTDTASVVQK